MNKAFEIDKGKDSLHSIGGIHLVGKTLKYCKLNDIFQSTRRSGLQFQDVDILKSQIGLLSQGREKFADISQFRGNEVFTKALGLKNVPSEESLRQRLEKMPATHNVLLDQSNLAFLKTRDFGTINKSSMTFIPVDMDVSPMDNTNSNKESVSRTYKGCDGYAPMFAYIGTEGFMLSNELRPGKQHSQKGMPEFLEKNFSALTKLKLPHPVLLRLDAAHDAEINFDHLPEEHYFIIKRNLRRETPEQWLALARRTGREQKSRDGKNVYIGEVHHKFPGNNESRSVVPVSYKITERITDHDGNKLLIPELDVATYWTNLPLEAQDIIALYQDHGTSEQFHSELKSDMNVERLPSGKFETNQLYLNCAMLAFNSLRMIGQLLIANKELAPVKIKGQRRRLRTVIRDLIFLACKHVKHSHKEVLKFGRSCPWFEVFQKISVSI
ncbi:MAG: IS1380 family transposase [Lentisphaeraceae bacterium]|nr:IS1380 family transposase [Lentisphaeraceae bacterium]